MKPDVLVADQDVKLARLYCRFLAGHGMKAESASSGLECLGMVRALSPQVLVLDHDLPWGDGEGVLARLREDDLALPVILTTWTTSPQIARQFIVPPVVVCLRKFFPLPALLDSAQIATNRFRGRDHSSDSLELSHQGDATWNASR